MGVNTEHTAVDSARDAEGALEVAGPNRAAQSVRGVIDCAKHGRCVGEGPDADNGREDFLAPTAVGGIDIENDRGLEECACGWRARAAARNFAIAGQVDELLDTFAVALCD